MPDRCLVHGCSNRSDMNAGISAHFSPSVTSERDTWLRYVVEIRAHSPRELKPSGKFVAGVFKSISRRNVFQERFTRVKPFYYAKTMTREGQGV